MALQSTYILSAEEIQKIRKDLPSSPGVGVEECLKRCNK
jgi:hypothetical protein